MTAIDRRPFTVFVASAIIILIFSYWLIHTSYFSGYPDIFAFAITVDTTLFLPLLYLLFAIRYRLSKILTIPIFLFSLLFASVIIPSDHHGLLDILKHLVAPLEALAAIYIIVKTRATIRAFKKGDRDTFGFIENLTASLSSTLGNKRVADIIATEISIFYYTFWGWRAKAESTKDAVAFSCHRANNYGMFVGGFVFLILMETGVLHLLLMQWSITAAWILTGLSIYGIVFLQADFNAIRQRPVLVGNAKLYLRIGLRWRTCIPFEAIEKVELTKKPFKRKQDFLDTSLLRDYNAIIVLKAPMQAIGYYGLRRKFRAAGLKIDDVTHFVKTLYDRIEANK